MHKDLGYEKELELKLKRNQFEYDGMCEQINMCKKELALLKGQLKINRQKLNEILDEYQKKL